MPLVNAIPETTITRTTVCDSGLVYGFTEDKASLSEPNMELEEVNEVPIENPAKIHGTIAVLQSNHPAKVTQSPIHGNEAVLQSNHPAKVA